MYNISLKIDRIHISQYLINYSELNRIRKGSSKKNIQYMTEFKNIAFHLDKVSYDIVRKGLKDLPYEVVDGIPYKNMFDNVSRFLVKISELESLDNIIKEVEKDKLEIESEWLKNQKLISKFLSTLGINDNRNVDIYLVPKFLLAGRYYNGKYIEWALRNDFPNYNSIYITHELIHNYIHDNDLIEDKEINEVVTMILSDRVLYFKLNHKHSNIDYSQARETHMSKEILNDLIDKGEKYFYQHENSTSIRDLISYINSLI